jgi:phosphatidylserine decarboxylase
MSVNYPHPPIAREGWPFLFITVLVPAVLTPVIGWWSAPLWLVALFVLQFFRDPGRAVPEQDNAVLSPADGRIIVVEKTIDPFRDRAALKISVFMNVFNVHANRVPLDGEVEKVDYRAGTFRRAALAKSSTQNERNAVLLRTDAGVEVTFVQIAGLFVHRILCYVRAGDRLVRGQRYGFIRFGSRVDIYLPPAARPRVAIGDKVWATRTILATLN